MKAKSEYLATTIKVNSLHDLDIQNEVYSTEVTGDMELTHEKSINTAAFESKEDDENCEDFHVSEKENLKQIWIFLKHKFNEKHSKMLV